MLVLKVTSCIIFAGLVILVNFFYIRSTLSESKKRKRKECAC